MTRRLSNQRIGGFTLVEVIVVIVVVVVLAAVLLPALSRRKIKEGRNSCVSNLRQVALGFRMWANEHGDRFPWAVSTNAGGTLEFAKGAEVFRHFNAASNVLNSPRILHCFKDTARVRASSWDQMTNNTAHLSYFTGLDADESRPQTILSGDRNLTTNRQPASGVIALTTNVALGFTRALHENGGNIALGDGSVQHVTRAALQQQSVAQVHGGTVQPFRLAIP